MLPSLIQTHKTQNTKKNMTLAKLRAFKMEVTVFANLSLTYNNVKSISVKF